MIRKNGTLFKDHVANSDEAMSSRLNPTKTPLTDTYRTLFKDHVANIDEAMSSRVNPTRPPLTDTNTPRLTTGWKRYGRKVGEDGLEDIGRGGEIGTYRIHKKYYTQCAMPSYNLKNFFYIKKYYRSTGDFYTTVDDKRHQYRENVIIFLAVDTRNHLDNDNAPETAIKTFYQPDNWLLGYKSCSEVIYTDEIHSHIQIKTKARRCGLAATLSYLCYRDKEHEPTIRGGTLGYAFREELKWDTPVNMLAAKDLQRTAKDRCQRVMKLINRAYPTAGSREYITAAHDAGYEILITFIKNNLGNKMLVSDTETLLEAFINLPVERKNFQLVDPVLDFFVNRNGRNWFFCKPHDICGSSTFYS